MIIFTKRLKLRPFKSEDIVWYFDMLQCDDLKNELIGIYTDNIKIAKEYLETFQKADFKNDFYYVIENRKTKQVMGIFIAVRISGRYLDVSYFLKEEYRHKGYMYETIKALKENAKTINPIYCYRLVIKKENTASLKVAMKFNPQIEEKEKINICYI